MTDYKEVSSRIADIILSPESAYGFIEGALSVPLDIGYLAYGYIDTDSYYTHQVERARIVQAIKNGLLSQNSISDAIESTLGVFTSHLSEDDQNRLYGRASFSIVGRFSTNYAIVTLITHAIAKKISITMIMRGGTIGNILLVGGMTERCIRQSEQLRVDVPELYSVLRRKDYDLLYFLFEPALRPFIEALSIRQSKGDSEFQKIIELTAGKLN